MDLQKALSDLGTDKDAVAATLRDMHIKGRKRSACNCPIANYLTLCGFVSPMLSGKHVRVGEQGERHTIETPAPIADFIKAFDHCGSFIELSF